MPEISEKPASVEAAQSYADYERLIPHLAEEVERLGAEMRALRDSGKRESADYAHLENQVIDALNKTTQLQQRMIQISEGKIEVPPPLTEMVHHALTQYEPDVARAERAFREALSGEIQTPEHSELPLELYDEQARILISEVGMLEWAFEEIPSESVTHEKLEAFHEGLLSAYERLTELDEKTPEHNDSRERSALIGLLKQLKERYPLTVAEPEPSAQAASAAYQNAKAEYAAVSHRLSEDRRRFYRARIARLALLTRKPEEYDEPAEGSSSVSFTSKFSIRSDVRVRAAMKEASLAARYITDALLPQPTKKGFLGVLADTFRLH